MIEELFFWKKWDREYKTIYVLLLFLALTLLSAYIVISFLGEDIALDWLITTRLESKTIIIGINNAFDIPATISTNLSVIQQYFEGSALKISTLASYIYLGIFSLGVAFCLTIATYLKRFLYLVTVALFIFLLFIIKLNALAFFGLEGNITTILFFMLFIPISYYFQDINKDISLKNRLQAFIGLTFIAGLMINFASQIESPFLHLASNIFIPAVIFTVVFIFLIGYEIVYSILIVTTQSGKQAHTNNTKHFIILSLIYLINLVLAYLKNTGKIDWDIYYINAFALFPVSTILGIWGMKDREVLYRNTLPFYPYTAILYMALAIISITTIAHHSIQSNDPVLETFEDAIIFGHIGFGFMFFIYIIANFISLLIKNLPVYRIAFKEDNFPYVTSRLAGFIVVAAFFFYSNKASLNQAIAGYFISQGDYHNIQEKNSPAIENYRYASMYAPNNHRSNYALSQLQNSKKESLRYVEKSTKKNPTPHAYVNTGLNFLNEGKFFDALFAYQEGVLEFPNSDELKNNLAVLYGGTKILDSAVYYLNTISDKDLKSNAGLTNRLALSALKNVDFEQSFSFEHTASNERLDVNANILAKLLLQPDTVLKPEFLLSNDNALNLISYAYLNNLGIWSYSNPNNSYLSIVETALANPANDEYKEQLMLFKALNLYNQGNVKEAFQTLSQLIGTYNGEGLYAFIAGLWSLEQNSVKLTLEFLEQSVEQGNQDAKIFFPLVLWLNNQSTKAQDYLSELAEKDSIDSRIPIAISLVASENQSMLQKINDNFEKIISTPSSTILDEITVSESENDLNRTDHLYGQVGNLNPFFIEGILAAANHFNEKLDQNKAYEILVNAMEINPYSEELVKAYIDQCFAMGLENYAETGLLKLLDILTKEEYDQYEMVFDLKKERLQQEDLNW